jgi:hypothetical protein
LPQVEAGMIKKDGDGWLIYEVKSSSSHDENKKEMKA